MLVSFHDIDLNRKLKYVVIQAIYKGKWIFVRHKDRSTWEIPGGHIEEGEKPNDAAIRELIEETGAINFLVEGLCDYSVTKGEKKSFGRLYYCEVSKLGKLGGYEIVEVLTSADLPSELTYKEIQPYLFEKVKMIKGHEE